MQNFFSKLITYIKFIFCSKPFSGHGIHSPFVYFLATEVLNKAKKNKNTLNTVEEIRIRMLHNLSLVSAPFLGAGVKTGSKPLIIGQIARKAGSNTKKMQALHALAKHHQPACIVELGTSLGFSAMALGLACPGASIFTIEGNPQLAQLAKSNILDAGITNIEVVNANFDDALPEILKNISTPFMVFIDGNHSFEPTLKYYTLFAEKACKQSLVVLDDIYWSGGMQQAWQQIKAHRGNSICIDLYSMGLVYFREGVEKQNFAIGRGLF